jgi:hypothetical protein
VTLPVLLRWLRLGPRVAAGPVALAGADVITILCRCRHDPAVLSAGPHPAGLRPKERATVARRRGKGRRKVGRKKRRRRSKIHDRK